MQIQSVEPGRVISVIMGGGAGTRLFPLTKERAKPAVPLAGKYRLVDIPISLCINSGLKRIFLLTQYLSSSLHRHVQQAYRFDDYAPRGFIEIMAATQRGEGTGWYQGTADAVRQNMHHFNNHNHDLVLILSGDQLYRMDYRSILAHHTESGAEVTVATIPVARADARSFGIMQIDESSNVVRFVEKPKDEELLDELRINEATRSRLSSNATDLYLASMGIYVFNRQALEEALSDLQKQDFGKDIIPAMIGGKKVSSFVYEGYWEDIGTIRAFYEANLDLTSAVPKFDFYDASSPIYSRSRNLPPTKVENSMVNRASISDGCIIHDSTIEGSVIGLRARIAPGVTVRDSIIMGSDYFETLHDLMRNEAMGRPALGIGVGSLIEGAIVDKNVRIGRNVTITARGKHKDESGSLYYVRDGIVVIPKNTTVPDNTVI